MSNSPDFCGQSPSLKLLMFFFCNNFRLTKIVEIFHILFTPMFTFYYICFISLSPYTRTYTHAHVHTCTHMCAHTHTYAHTCTHMHRCTHTHFYYEPFECKLRIWCPLPPGTSPSTENWTKPQYNYQNQKCNIDISLCNLQTFKFYHFPSMALIIKIIFS